MKFAIFEIRVYFCGSYMFLFYISAFILQEQQQKQEQLNLEEKQQEQKQSELPSIKDTIASCVAGVGFPDLSQIKISESVTKILSSIRHQGITPINVSPSASISSAALDTTEAAQTEKYVLFSIHLKNIFFTYLHEIPLSSSSYFFLLLLSVEFRNRKFRNGIKFVIHLH